MSSGGRSTGPREKKPATRLPGERRPAAEVAGDPARSRLRDHPRLSLRPRLPGRVAGRERCRLRLPAAARRVFIVAHHVGDEPEPTGEARSAGSTRKARSRVRSGRRVDRRMPRRTRPRAGGRPRGDHRAFGVGNAHDSVPDRGVMWQGRSGLELFTPNFDGNSRTFWVTCFSPIEKCRSRSLSQTSSARVGVPEGPEGHPADREERPRVPATQEGGIAFPDPIDRPSRTILTGEGGARLPASST